MTTSSAHHADAGAETSADAYPIDDLLLPLAQITRIFKETVPDKMSLSREARVGMNQATITFVNFITALSQEIAVKAKKKTISANDVLSAIEGAGFQEFLPILREALDQLQKQKEDKKSNKQATSSTTAGESATRSSGSAPAALRASLPAPAQASAGEAQGESDTDLEEEIDIMDTT